MPQRFTEIDGDGPFCPQESYSPLHKLGVEAINLVYENGQKHSDDSGEFVNEETEKIFRLIEKKLQPRMHLRIGEDILKAGKLQINKEINARLVTYSYYQCPLCGFVLGV